MCAFVVVCLCDYVVVYAAVCVIVLSVCVPIPPGLQCPSCGSSMRLAGPSGSHVLYKTIIGHYNQVTPSHTHTHAHTCTPCIRQNHSVFRMTAPTRVG